MQKNFIDCENTAASAAIKTCGQ